VSTVGCLAYTSTLNRIAALTSVSRTRAEDQLRFERRGGTPAELCDRVRAAVERLEKVADQLEEALG
jgi:hypothetical protein